MKKLAIFAILLILAIVAWNAAFDPSDMHVVFGGEELHGPLAALVGVLAGSVGLVIGLLAMLFAAVVVAVVFAGLGALALVGLALGATVLALMVSPLMLPLALIAGIAWLVMKRGRRPAAPPQITAA